MELEAYKSVPASTSIIFISCLLFFVQVFNASSNIIVMGLHNLYAKSYKISGKIMNAGKRHFGHWSPLRGHAIVSVLSGCSSDSRNPSLLLSVLCPREAGEKEKKSACLLYFDYSAGASGRGRRDCFAVREDWG